MSEFPDSFDDADEPDDTLPLRELNRLQGRSCLDCHAVPSSCDLVCNIALGFANAVRCWRCLTKRLDRESKELQEQLHGYVNRRDCYRVAWQEALRLDGKTEVATAMLDVQHPTPATRHEADEEWNAGDLGCGELVMALRMRLKTLSPGNVIRVTATDPAAPEDLPAWCRLSGHTLVAMTHPDYFIRRKGDD